MAQGMSWRGGRELDEVRTLRRKGDESSGDRKRHYKSCRCVNSPVLGDGARMAFTPNFRKLGSLLCGTDVLGEHDSRVTAMVTGARSADAQVKDAVVVTVGSPPLAGGPVRLMKEAGRLIRSRSSTRKLDGFGKMEGRVWWSGRAAAGRYKPA